MGRVQKGKWAGLIIGQALKISKFDKRAGHNKIGQKTKQIKGHRAGMEP